MEFFLVSPSGFWLLCLLTLLLSVFWVFTVVLVTTRQQKKIQEFLGFSKKFHPKAKKTSTKNFGIVSLILIGFICILATKIWWLGLAFSFVLYIFMQIIRRVQHQKKRLKLVKQLPLMLQGLSNGLKAGYSLPQAFAFMETELENPLLYEVKKINRGIQIKKPITEVLQDFAKRMNEENVHFFAESTIIQLRVGGNLVHLFSKVSHLIEDKLKLRQDLKTFTSQGKMSGILLALLWPISLLFFWIISPSHVSILFASTSGNILLFVSLLLELIGFYCIWRIVRVRI